MGRAGTGPLQAPPALTDPFILGDRRFLSRASRINISLMTRIFTKLDSSLGF